MTPETVRNRFKDQARRNFTTWVYYQLLQDRDILEFLLDDGTEAGLNAWLNSVKNCTTSTYPSYL